MQRQTYLKCVFLLCYFKFEQSLTHQGYTQSRSYGIWNILPRRHDAKNDFKSSSGIRCARMRVRKSQRKRYMIVDEETFLRHLGTLDQILRRKKDDVSDGFFSFFLSFFLQFLVPFLPNRYYDEVGIIPII